MSWLLILHSKAFLLPNGHVEAVSRQGIVVLSRRDVDLLVIDVYVENVSKFYSYVVSNLKTIIQLGIRLSNCSGFGYNRRGNE